MTIRSILNALALALVAVCATTTAYAGNDNKPTKSLNIEKPAERASLDLFTVLDQRLAEMRSASTVPRGVWAFVIIGGGLTLYFLPTIVACCRGKAHGVNAIALLNFVLGWTVAGWWIAMIWASTGTTKAEQQAEAKRHAELLAALNSKVIR